VISDASPEAYRLTKRLILLYRCRMESKRGRTVSHRFDSKGRTIWLADTHRGDGKHFVVHADKKRQIPLLSLARPLSRLGSALLPGWASAFGPRDPIPQRRIGPLAPTPDRREAAVEKRRLNLPKVEDRLPHSLQNPYEVIDAGLQ
jgi:hypothetical protein